MKSEVGYTPQSHHLATQLHLPVCTEFHVATPVAAYDLRKVELTPLEQRKLTFDSHAMVIELESNGGCIILDLVYNSASVLHFLKSILKWKSHPDQERQIR